MDHLAQQEQDQRQSPTDPLAELDCSVSLTGTWTLRSYKNNYNVERIRIQRIRSEESRAAADVSRKPTLLTVLPGGILAKGVPQQNLYGEKQQKPTSPGKNDGHVAGDALSSSHETTAVPHGAFTSPRIIIDGEECDPRLVPDLPRQRGRRQYVPPPTPRSAFKGTAVGGYRYRLPGEDGEWYFQTFGGGADGGGNDAHAAVNMGGDQVFRPSKPRPTAEDVYNYRKCRKARQSTSVDLSHDISIVWRTRDLIDRDSMTFGSVAAELSAHEKDDRGALTTETGDANTSQGTPSTNKGVSRLKSNSANGKKRKGSLNDGHADNEAAARSSRKSRKVVQAISPAQSTDGWASRREGS